MRRTYKIVSTIRWQATYGAVSEELTKVILSQSAQLVKKRANFAVGQTSRTDLKHRRSYAERRRVKRCMERMSESWFSRRVSSTA